MTVSTIDAVWAAPVIRIRLAAKRPVIAGFMASPL
jgi:hypothetical protein